MELQELVNLIQLRRFLHEVQQGFTSVSKEQLRGITVKIKELDITIVKNALTSNLTTKASVEFISSESDFQESNRLVEEARKKAEARKAISKAGADIEKAAGGVTLASAPPDPVEEVDPATMPKPKAPAKRKSAFSRTEE